MKPELLKKFNTVIDYYSDYEESGNKSLKNVVLQTYFEIEPIGTIRMDIWITLSDFFENSSEPAIIYKHQTVFKLLKGQQLTENELVEMFRFTEKRFLNREIKFDNNSGQKIMELYQTGDPIPTEKILDMVKGGSSYISTIWN